VTDQTIPKQPDEPDADARAPIGMVEFLTQVRPLHERSVADLYVENTKVTTGKGLTIDEQFRSLKEGEVLYQVQYPNLQLECDSELCDGGVRTFQCRDGKRRAVAKRGTPWSLETFLYYVCANCGEGYKIYAVVIEATPVDSKLASTCLKIGEYPVYGPLTPSRLLRMLGQEKDLFLKGRRCEGQGLGVGAFAYYRRVVENQKDRIFDEVIRVCEKSGAPAATIAKFKAARKQRQFTTALEGVKDIVPIALFINGQNPLTALHRALSVGLHATSDERCLEFAHDGRLVFVELVERLGQILKDGSELNAAINRLVKIDKDD
jgi:hypothetical protein